MENEHNLENDIKLVEIGIPSKSEEVNPKDIVTSEDLKKIEADSVVILDKITTLFEENSEELNSEEGQKLLNQQLERVLDEKVDLEKKKSTFFDKWFAVTNPMMAQAVGSVLWVAPVSLISEGVLSMLGYNVSDTTLLAANLLVASGSIGAVGVVATVAARIIQSKIDDKVESHGREIL